MLQNRSLDKTVPIPLYFQLKSMLLEEIKNNSYPVESMIPTEKELSEMFQISRTTVRQAITELVQEGWLYRVKSKGTFVARAKIQQDFIRRLETFSQQMERVGRVPSTELLDFKVIPITAHDACQALQVNPGTEGIFLYRKRLADNDPIVTVKTILPYDKCSFIMGHDFAKESLYNTLSQRPETKICRVNRIVEAVAANSKDVELLQVRHGKPIHYFATTGYNYRDQPIEYSQARYRGDRNRFEVDLYIETGNTL